MCKIAEKYFVATMGRGQGPAPGGEARANPGFKLLNKFQ